MVVEPNDERPGSSMWTPLQVTRDTSSDEYEEEIETRPAPSRKRKPSSGQMTGHGAKRLRTTDPQQRIRSLTLDGHLLTPAAPTRVINASASTNTPKIASTSRSVPQSATPRSRGLPPAPGPSARQRRQTEPGPVASTSLQVPIKQENRSQVRKTFFNTADSPIVIISDSEEEKEKTRTTVTAKARLDPPRKPSPEIIDLCSAEDEPMPLKPPVSVLVKPKSPAGPTSAHASSSRPLNALPLKAKTVPTTPTSQALVSAQSSIRASVASAPTPSTPSIVSTGTFTSVPLSYTTATTARLTVAITPSTLAQPGAPFTSNAAPTPVAAPIAITRPAISSVTPSAPNMSGTPLSEPQVAISRAAARAGALPMQQRPPLSQAAASSSSRETQADKAFKSLVRRTEDELRHAKVVPTLKVGPPSQFKGFSKSSMLPTTSSVRPSVPGVGAKAVVNIGQTTVQVNSNSATAGRLDPTANRSLGVVTASHSSPVLTKEVGRVINAYRPATAEGATSRPDMASPGFPASTAVGGSARKEAIQSEVRTTQALPPLVRSSASNDEPTLPGRPLVPRSPLARAITSSAVSPNGEKTIPKLRRVRTAPNPMTSDDDHVAPIKRPRYFGCGESSCVRKGRAFSSITKLNQHHIERHNALPVYPYLCAADGCASGFKSERALIEHIQNVHRSTTPPSIVPQSILPATSPITPPSKKERKNLARPAVTSGASSAASTGRGSASPKDGPPPSASSDEHQADDEEDPPMRRFGRRERIVEVQPAAVARPATATGATAQKRPVSGQSYLGTPRGPPPQHRLVTDILDSRTSSCSPSAASSDDDGSANDDDPVPMREQHHRRATDKGMNKTRAMLEQLAIPFQEPSQETGTPSLPPPPPPLLQLEHEAFHAEAEANRPDGILINTNLGLDFETARQKWPGDKVPSHLHSQIHELPTSFQRHSLQLVFQAAISSNTAADEPFAPPIEIINNISDDPYREMCPPFEFYYTNRMIRGEGVPPPTEAEGCDCIGPCRPSSVTCRCAILQRKATEHGCAYDEDGSLAINPALPAFECHPGCQCGDACPNKVVQKGRTCQIQVKKTKHKGWGVFSPNPLPKGTYIGTYSGELLLDSVATERAEFYDDFGRTYLFNLDSFHLHLQKNVVFYAIDAFHVGNFTRFLNHSCEPNCKITPVYTTDRDFHKPLLCLFTCRAVRAGEELCFSYAGDDTDDETAPVLPKKGRPRKQQQQQQQQQMEQEGKSFARCQCKAPRCKGSMWRKVENDEENEDIQDEALEQDNI